MNKGVGIGVDGKEGAVPVYFSEDFVMVLEKNLNHLIWVIIFNIIIINPSEDLRTCPFFYPFVHKEMK